MEPQKVDLLVIVDNDGDTSFRFVKPELFKEFAWPEGMAHADYVRQVWERVGAAIERNDPDIVRYELAMPYCQDAGINQLFCIGKILVLEG